MCTCTCGHFAAERRRGQRLRQHHDGLSFFRNAYDSFASYRAAIIRLDNLVDSNEKARGLPMLVTENCTDGTVSLHGVEVRIPAGDLLVNPLDLHLD